MDNNIDEPKQGSLNGTDFEGITQCQIYVSFEGFLIHNALFGLNNNIMILIKKNEPK